MALGGYKSPSLDTCWPETLKMEIVRLTLKGWYGDGGGHIYLSMYLSTQLSIYIHKWEILIWWTLKFLIVRQSYNFKLCAYSQQWCWRWWPWWRCHTWRIPLLLLSFSIGQGFYRRETRLVTKKRVTKEASHCLCLPCTYLPGHTIPFPQFPARSLSLWVLIWQVVTAT